jgi:hypothetical protein
MNNADLESDSHWLIKMAQDIRENRIPELTSGKPAIAPDLAHSSLSLLGELIDRCSFDIEPEFLRGYAYGLNQVGLIDEVVLRAIEKFVGAGNDYDVASKSDQQH